MRRLRRYIPPLVITLALLVAYRAWPRDHVLTSEATPLLKVDSWKANGYALGLSAIRYRWLSDTHVLHTRRLSENDWTVTVYDTESRAETNVAPNLAALLIDSPNFPWLVSPDGQKIAIEKAGQADLHMLALVDMSGHVIAEWPGYETPAGWLDSNTYVSWEFDGPKDRALLRTTRYSVTGERKSTDYSRELADTVVKNSPETQLERAFSSMSNSMPNLPSNRFDARGGRLFAIEANTTPMSLVVEPADSTKPERFPIDLPEGWEYQEYLVSPRGNLIAWVLTAKPTPRYSEFLRKVFPWLRGDIPARTGLWVSDWKGRHMREIGHKYVFSEPQPISFIPELPIIDKLQWLPGERGISFVNDNTLYVSRVN